MILTYINIKLAIIFTRNTTKEYYNSYYTPIKLNISEIVYLRLYKGYQLLRKLNYKIFKQRISLFKVKKRIRKLIYELDLLPYQKIYPVISITYLVLALNSNNSFKRLIINS